MTLCFSQGWEITAAPGSTVTFAMLDSDTTQTGGGIIGIYGYLTSAS